MECIYNKTIEDLEEYFLNKEEKKFKTVQLFLWLYQKRVTSYDIEIIAIFINKTEFQMKIN